MILATRRAVHQGDLASRTTFDTQRFTRSTAGAAFDGTQCATPPPGHGAAFHTFDGAAFDCTTCATPPPSNGDGTAIHTCRCN